MKLVQYFAVIKRSHSSEIINKMNIEVSEQFTTIHNYIDIENILLKGAISAQR